MSEGRNEGRARTFTREEIRALAESVLDGLGLPKDEGMSEAEREMLEKGAREWRRRKGGPHPSAQALTPSPEGKA